jgi:hypothetical protein
LAARGGIFNAPSARAQGKRIWRALALTTRSKSVRRSERARVSNGKSELEEVGEAVFATAVFSPGDSNWGSCYLAERDARIRIYNFFHITYNQAAAAAPTQNAWLSNENVTEMQRRQKVEMNGERQSKLDNRGYAAAFLPRATVSSG